MCIFFLSQDDIKTFNSFNNFTYYFNTIYIKLGQSLFYSFYSTLIIETPERCVESVQSQWRRAVIFIDNFERNLLIVLVFLVKSCMYVWKFLLLKYNNEVTKNSTDWLLERTNNRKTWHSIFYIFVLKISFVGKINIFYPLIGTDHYWS